jgi:hypothetical protein
MQNPKLNSYSMLVGEWNTIGTHPALPGTILRGHVTVAWIEDGAYLQMRTEVEDERVPNGVLIFGSDDASELVTILYFDVRGVSRIFAASLDGNVLKFWRDAPGFLQRFTGTIADDHNSIQVITEISEDGSNWVIDLEQTFTRVE